VYLARIVDRKESHGQVFLVTDGGLHHQLAASGNFGTVVRRNYPAAIATKFGAEPEESQSIVGCLCTPLDRLADQAHCRARGRRPGRDVLRGALRRQRQPGHVPWPGAGPRSAGLGFARPVPHRDEAQKPPNRGVLARKANGLFTNFRDNAARIQRAGRSRRVAIARTLVCARQNRLARRLAASASLVLYRLRRVDGEQLAPANFVADAGRSRARNT
jgi:hypothetical protein